LGGASVGVSKGECSGEVKGESKAAAGVAVGGLDAVGTWLAVGDAVGVAVSGAGLVSAPGDGDAGAPVIFWPQADRKAASAVAPAPFRKRRRSIGNLVFVISLF
jgi:hypothetical protein